MAASNSRPEKLTGGCLCEAIRYTITIPPETDWPPTLVRVSAYFSPEPISPEQNGTCQCTMCRKFTGALVQTGCSFPSSSIPPPLASNPSYTQYVSSEKGIRGFCRICGSSLTFNRPGGDKTEILFGSIDEEILKSKVG